jgi:Secretion system C-terminal sorting domain/Vault protein inter-alpha-trypsin domain
MQNFTKSLLCFFLFLTHFYAQSQNSLRVQDPRQGFRSGIGQIDSAAITIRPKGIYAEVGYYLTYSSKSTTFTNRKDTLEVQHYFNLPKDVQVSDSWLWFQDFIIRAKIIDRWTASTIYNNIVGLRQDPSILLKNGATSYELRIYPMAGSETRRVKLTFLIPMRWQSNTAVLDLPLGLITISNNLPKLNVRVFENADWKNPSLRDLPNAPLREQTDSLGKTLGTVLDLTSLRSVINLKLQFESPAKNGVYLSRLPINANEGFYQLMIAPSQVADLQSGNRKILVALDYNVANTNIQKSAILSNLKDNLKATLTSKDSFNLIFSKLNPTPLSNSWFSTAQLDSVFATLNNNSFSNISNLPTLLLKSLEFLKTNRSGKLIVYSSDASFNNSTSSNELIDELKKTSNPLPPFHILDFSNNHHTGFSAGNLWYVGNSYLYTNLARQSGGNTYDINSQTDLTFTTTSLYQNINGVYDNLDVYTTLNDGYCHSRFILDETNKGFSSPVLMVGKYRGKMPFRIEVSGTYGTTDFSKKLSIAETDMALSDNTLQYFWAGQQIAKLETGTTDNATVAQVIETSISNRILSRYTAFLALEPAQGGDTCKVCDKNDGKFNDSKGVTATATKEISDKVLKLVATPNPFKTETTIKLTFESWKESGKARIFIYDLTGKIVKTIDLDIKQGDTEASLILVAQDMPSGIYIARFVGGNIQKTIKLVKIE